MSTTTIAECDEALVETASRVISDIDGRLAVSFTIEGVLCPASARPVAAAIDSILRHHSDELRIDLRRLRLCDSHGNDLLEDTRHRMRRPGRTVHLSGAEGVVRYVRDIVETADPVVAPSDDASGRRRR